MYITRARCYTLCLYIIIITFLSHHLTGVIIPVSDSFVKLFVLFDFSIFGIMQLYVSCSFIG
ncbi:hypothetical protein C2G38_2097432 [Gigaspora rosea]|uniref:Uncharacterized protein n=1 Tax=Gigaspora rosea TaxID=44941 RepID=A0A397UUA9_9GLOM|nr:hypothetical protein C2G38_2097432 [Gigaspora rosea]